MLHYRRWFVAMPVTLGCSNLLGADFDEARRPPEFEVRVLLAAHPSDAKGAAPKSTGAGTVTSTDEAIACGERCTARYDRQTLILAAEPAEDSAFAGWRTEPPGPCSGSRSPRCELEIDANVTIEAYFVSRGANVWFTPIGSSGADSATAVAVGSTGRSYAAGNFAGTVTHDRHTWQSLGSSDVFLMATDPDGTSASAKLIQSQGQELITDLAADDDAVIAAGWVSGESSAVAYDVIPFQWTVTGSHAFIAGFDTDLNYRWFFPVDGAAESYMGSVGVDAAGRIFAVGSLYGSLVGDPPSVGASELDADILFVSLAPDGGLRWMTELGAPQGHQAAVSLGVQSNGSIVIAGDAGAGFDPTARGGSCAALAEGGFVARFDESGKCLDARNVSTLTGDGVTSVALTSDDGLVMAGFTHPDTEVDLSEGQDASAVVPGATTFVVRLNERGAWEAGKSWVRLLQGSTKVMRIGALGEQVLISISLEGDLQVGSEIVSLVPGRAFFLLALDETGALAWHRSWRSPQTSVFFDIAAHAPSHTWFLAGHADSADPGVEADFESITQDPFLVQATDAVLARVAP